MAELPNQRMVLRGRESHFAMSCKIPARYSGNVTFWAWMASIGVHIIVLMVFAAVKFSPVESKANQYPTPTAKINRIKRLTETTLTIPKPKIKLPNSVVGSGQVAKSAGKIAPLSEIFDSVKPSRQDWPILDSTSAARNVFSQQGREILQREIEFFGSCTDSRKVCYLVDCSGSMHGIFSRVQEELKESIRKLHPDQYFYIIFFGDDRLFEFGDGKLVRATRKSKSAACDFIDLVSPAGQTNAMQAWERVVKIRDEAGVGPAIVYFLTDGFELTDEDKQRFLQKISNLLKRFTPTMKINAIGFWPSSSDRRMLERIAKQSGGEFIFITD